MTGPQRITSMSLPLETGHSAIVLNGNCSDYARSEKAGGTIRMFFGRISPIRRRTRKM